MRIISHSDLNEFKHISTNISAAMFDRYVLEAQELDLRGFLGTELFIDILDKLSVSPQETTYNDLINGSTYTKNGRKYKHEGLKAVLAYYTYARYLQNTGIASTPYGVVQKKNDFSDPITEKSLARIIFQAESAGKAYWERVKQFLCDNKTDYPLFRFHVYNSQHGNGLKISGIGGNSKNKYYNR